MIEYIDPNLLQASPNNIRTSIDDESINELAQSINTMGLLNPISVISGPDKYTIVAGHRRYLAWLRSEYATKMIPCIVLSPKLGDDYITVTMLVENCQRVDITPLDEAFAFAELKNAGWKQKDIALKVGKSDAFVSKRLALTTLPDVLLAKIKNDTLTIAQAVQLSHLPTEALLKNKWDLKKQVSDWEIRQLESAVQREKENQILRDWLQGRTDIVEDAPDNAYYVGRFTGASIDRCMIADGMVIRVAGNAIEVYDTTKSDDYEDDDEDDGLNPAYTEWRKEKEQLWDKYQQDLKAYTDASESLVEVILANSTDRNRLLNAILLGWLLDYGDFANLSDEAREDAETMEDAELFLKYLDHPNIQKIFILSNAGYAEQLLQQELLAHGIVKPERPTFQPAPALYVKDDDDEEDYEEDESIVDDVNIEIDPIEDDWDDDCKGEFLDSYEYL